MYDDGYDDEMDYGDDMSEDGENNVSDEDEEELGEMGHIEGLSANPGVVEVIMGDEDDEDEDMDEDDDEEPSDEDDEVDSEDIEEIEEQIEILDEAGNLVEDDGNSGWESETDEDEEDEEEIDYDAAQHDLDEAHIHAIETDQLGRFGDMQFDDRFIDEGAEEDGKRSLSLSCQLLLTYLLIPVDEEDEEEEVDDDEYIYDQDYPRKSRIWLILNL